MPEIKLQTPPEWGIDPVPKEHRLLGFFDILVLWGDLGVGLLVLAAGALLVPGLGLAHALVAIVVGTVIGNLLLALAGILGSTYGVPTMVSLRGVLGMRGSYLPSILNVIQLIGWGAFEIIIMAQVANTITERVFAVSAYVPWTAFFAIFCTLMAVGGPLVVVRQWLEKFALWLVLLTTVILTGYLFTHYDVPALLAQPGNGQLSFWIAVDLVIAMPVSWLPLVSDYNRFARDTGRAFWGTYAGYFIANIWFYGLGALMVLALQANDLTAALAALAAGITVAGLPVGWLGVLVILADETDNAFADIYSAAVSGQNMRPQTRQRLLAITVGALCFVLAAIVPLSEYQGFLLLMGSFFVPLFGVLFADFFLLRQGRYDVKAIYEPNGAYWYSRGINWWAIVAWLIGVVAYQSIAPSVTLPGIFNTWHDAIAQAMPWLGASIPSFLLSLALYLIFARVAMKEVWRAKESIA